jgi:hypothetical protein
MIASLSELHARCASDGSCLMYPKTAHRYGIITTVHGRDTTHRSAWKLSGKVIPPGMCVLHKCDKPRCCNVDHLWIGTQAQNMADRFAKGRIFVLKAGRNPNRPIRSIPPKSTHKKQGFPAQRRESVAN